ncbi:UvrD-helicase domain-containing protein [Alteribacter aurantiacus]|uniref:UvrD-helicase domain-containing protein n=1 Tax=Alteribacter aurantiacus TaxID=254410 RepID=UPI0004092E9F|nr:ATP-dependent helicase [Alteribacter aurantiacus]
MQRAKHMNTTYELTSLDRGKLHTVYQKSKKGELTCPYCGEPVTLKLHINTIPLFTHRKPSLVCEEKDTETDRNKTQEPGEALAKETASATVGSFSLPIKKTISSISSEPTNKKHCFKLPLRFSTQDRVNTNSKEPSYSVDPVLKRIEEQGTPLNEKQQKAVTTIDGPVLLLAGAGSGKTRVLTSRAAYMILSGHVGPGNMMLVTFTQKAAQEMKERLSTKFGLPGHDVRNLVCGTFHSLFYKMLMHHDPSNWRPEQLLNAQWQKEKIVHQALRELSIDEKEFAIDQAITTISAWKNEGLSPSDVKPQDHFENELKDVFAIYEREKASKNMFDFDDMLLGCYQMLKEDPDLLSKYQSRFTHFMIDEFQDINRIQYDIMQLLVTPQNHLCVVGDDDQSIYRFRGSDPSYILNFKDQYPNATILHLEQNYRSEQNIVDLANAVICRNTSRFEKKMSPVKVNTNEPLLFFPYDEEEEAIYIIEHIKEKLKTSSKPEDIAILYRTHVQARAIFEQLLESGLPFSMEYAGDSFYDRQVVRKALSFLRLALNGDDVEAIEDWIRVMFFKQSILRDLKRHTIFHDETMLEATRRIEETLPPFQRKKLGSCLNEFPKLKGMKPKDALHHAFVKMGLEDYIKKNGKEGNKMERGSDDYHELVSIASNYETIEEFVTYVDHIRAKIKAHKKDNQKSAVQLMTIHRAKGLEFPTVYVLGCNEGSLPHEYALEKSREGDDSFLEEERRLMYVALTRAEHQLFLSTTDMRRGKKSYRSRFLRDIRFKN